MKRIAPFKLLIALAIGLSPLLTFEPVAANGGLRTVELTGDAAPGTAPGITFSTFGSIDASPALNNSGQVAFTRHLAGTGGFANDSGIWSEGGGSGLSLVAREGTTIAPGATVGFLDFYGNQLSLNSKGQIAFKNYLDTSQPSVNSSNDTGVWSQGGGSGLALIAREGKPAPGTSGNFDDVYVNGGVAFNNSGQTAFTTTLARPTINDPIIRGIWSEGAGSGLALFTRTGSVVPGVPATASYGLLDRIMLNGSGKIAFRASLTGSGVNLTNDDGIWSDGGGSGLALIAREGNPAPGAAAGVTFAGFSSNGPLAFNSLGRTAFMGFLTGTGVNPQNQSGVWREGGAGLALVARAGDQAPGAAAGVNFDFNTFTQSLALNDNGNIAFWVTLQGAGTGTGIWSDAHGSGLALVARTGSQAPGVEAGVNFNSFNNGISIELNNGGQTAFWASLTGTGINSTNDNGIWAEDQAGNLELIVREGGQLDVSNNPLIHDLRTVSDISALAGNTGNSDGRPSSFNDLGQLAFVARFTDGSEGVFVSNLVAVPEPATLALMMFAAAIYLPRHRRPLWA